ncbi:DUF2937 family protein [Photobacterium sp. BZF1]|uniref:DUF2937 family protein n=1 Tax=Photobacterium sp. BZF1 TaxID=1904457 RepID=UPI001653B23F|nr:DUF2937 family protein [Photobacterium sp. BZF1]MBC7004616.1 DUF2937 family protein [Photobacterium sp. BZF1]
MIKRILDRLVFGGLLIATLQIPMLADHYLQYLSGFYDATTQQVEAYRSNARQHGFDSAESMVSSLLQEDNPVVRVDAEQKLKVLQQHEMLEQGMAILAHGHLVDKTLYMFNPARFNELQRVLVHFTLGIPLDVSSIAFCIVAALGLNLVLYLPFVVFRRQHKNTVGPVPSTN